MAGQMIFDLVDLVELTEYVRAYDQEVLREEARFGLGKFLPDKEVDDLDFRIRTGTLQDEDAAEYRAWDTPAPFAGRQGTAYMRGTLAPISRQIFLGEEESLRLRALDRQSNDPIITQIYQDAERMIRAVKIRAELARGDLIDDGVVTISENGLTLEADWGRDASMSQTATTVYSNPAANALSELLAWQQDYYDLNGVLPGYLRVTTQQLALLTTNSEFLAASGSIREPERLTNTQVQDIMAQFELPPIWKYESKFRVNGTQVSVLPADKMYFMPPDGEPYGDTFWGVTAEAIKLVEKGLIDRTDAAGLLALVYQNEHPVQTFTVGTGISLPATPNVNLVMDLTVL